jgi:two-component sensor histidine kinase
LAEERMLTTTRELQHRVKNSLTVVQAIAAQSFRSAKTKEEGLAAFTGRLQALATATELITRGNWATVAIEDIVAEIIKPYRDAGSDRITTTGAPIRIDSKNATSLGMALHELCTNALKYGALSNDLGSVAISWWQEEAWLRLHWQESGGPAVPARPGKGFGTRLLAGGLFDPGTGSVEISFEPAGVECAIRVAIAGSSAFRS